MGGQDVLQLPGDHCDDEDVVIVVVVGGGDGGDLDVVVVVVVQHLDHHWVVKTDYSFQMIIILMTMQMLIIIMMTMKMWLRTNRYKSFQDPANLYLIMEFLPGGGFKHLCLFVFLLSDNLILWVQSGFCIS